jgi:hypothetical protein
MARLGGLRRGKINSIEWWSSEEGKGESGRVLYVYVSEEDDLEAVRRGGGGVCMKHRMWRGVGESGWRRWVRGCGCQGTQVW